MQFAQSKRREVIMGLACMAFWWPASANAEGTGKVWRIGFVLTGTQESVKHFPRELEQRLSDLGYVRDRNIILINRVVEPNPKDIEDALSSLSPAIDLLVVGGTVGGVAAKKVMSTKPVVFVSVGAPVEIGLVKSLSHPGGNMTGITFEASKETYGKRLQILKEILPNLRRVAVLQARGDANVEFAMGSLETAGPQLGVMLSPVSIGSGGELGAAFDKMKQDRAEALIVIAGALTYSNGKQISDLALTHQLPSCHAFRETVAAGGLMSLGPDLVAMLGQAATYIDKIIRGASPSELPVQQPARYQFAINLKTARALGLEIPLPLLARADEVIE